MPKLTLQITHPTRLKGPKLQKANEKRVDTQRSGLCEPHRAFLERGPQKPAISRELFSKCPVEPRHADEYASKIVLYSDKFQKYYTL